jgi:hypothetical protein
MPCGSNRGCKMLADPMRYSTRCSIARAANVSVSSASLSRNLGQDNDLRAVPNSIFSRLEQQISRACSIDQRSSLLEADGELWAECAKIGDMGYTSLVEDPEADVEPHFVCFAGLNGQLAMFDGDRTSGPLVLHIALGVGGLIPDQAKDAVKIATSQPFWHWLTMRSETHRYCHTILQTCQPQLRVLFQKLKIRNLTIHTITDERVIQWHV